MVVCANEVGWLGYHLRIQCHEWIRNENGAVSNIVTAFLRASCSNCQVDPVAYAYHTYDPNVTPTTTVRVLRVRKPVSTFRENY
jgi:hypothetical protein